MATIFPSTIINGVWCCGMCPKQIAQAKKSGISYHKNTHFPKYICETCNSSFAQKCQMDVHIRIAHTGEKPYSCADCDCSFPQMSNLNDHRARVHATTEKPRNRKAPLTIAWYKEQVDLLRPEFPTMTRLEIMDEINRRWRALKEKHGAGWRDYLVVEGDSTPIPGENPGA